MMAILFKFIYMSFEKLFDEDTKIRHYHQNDGAELPSVTICLKWLSAKVPHTNPIIKTRDLAIPNTLNWTFDEYMEKTFLVKNILMEADFHDQPTDKNALYVFSIIPWYIISRSKSIENLFFAVQNLV